MLRNVLYQDRTEAGRSLAPLLREYRRRPDAIVLALPRGGVPVGYEVAAELEVALDVFIVRKLGFPGHEELAFGAIASGGTRVLNDDLVRSLHLTSHTIQRVTEREQRELQRREQHFRGDRPFPALTGKTVILVDDGLATGASMRAAAEAIRKHDPSRLIVAVPVAAEATCSEFRRYVDEIVCAATPEPFLAVGVWYGDFRQTTDEEVRLLLERSEHAAVP